MKIEWLRDEKGVEICDGELRRKPLKLKDFEISKALKISLLLLSENKLYSFNLFNVNCCIEQS